MITYLALAPALLLSFMIAEGQGYLNDQQQPIAFQDPATRVAIVGAGSAGASAAFYLRNYSRHAGVSLNITVFDSNIYVGGRSTTVSVHDDPECPVELGASIFVEANKNLVAAVKEFDLSTRKFSDAKGSGTRDAAPDVGIWNGQQLLVSFSDGWWASLKLFWRYGLASVRTKNLVKATVGKFLKMYEPPHFPWRSIQSVANDVELLDVVAYTGEQHLKQNSISDLFAREVIQASTRVNYAQNLDSIHGLETMVCMAASGTMAVKGGNWQIFAKMLDAAGATVLLNTSVISVRRHSDGSYTLGYLSSKSHQAVDEDFDTVILAAPYHAMNLLINPQPEHIPSKVDFVSLHVTLFVSPHDLSPLAFGLGSNEPVPNTILTTLPCTTMLQPHGHLQVGRPGFFSISRLMTLQNPNCPSNATCLENLYKVFSAERVNATFLSHILSHNATDPEISWMHRKVWQSYPYLAPRKTFDDPRLDANLWYTGGIEPFISTMETSSLMGMNVARLIVDEWSGI